MHPGDGWNASLDTFLHTSLCGPLGAPNSATSTTPSLLYCSPEERLREEVCTFASTQYHFIEQPWYGCYTCDMVASRGACHLCARLCHAGHDLFYMTTSDFFCDCAADMSPIGKCCCVTRRLVRGNSGETGKDGLFSNFLPWTNGELST